MAISKIILDKHKIFKDVKIENLKTNNIFFGWNGTGKSTISNIFYEISKSNETPQEYNGFFKDKNNNDANIISKVFNKKYIQNNLSGFLDGDNKQGSITLIGEDNKENNDKLISEENAKNNLDEELKTNEVSLKTETDKLEGKKLSIAQLVKTSLGESRAENKNSINLDVIDTLQSLDETELNDKVKTFQQKALGTITELNIDDFGYDFNDEEFKLQELLDKNPVNEVIDELKNNQELNNWVLKGLEINTNDECGFCKNTVSAERKEQLQNHFNQDYNNLISQLNTAKTTYKQRISIIDSTINTKLSIYKKDNFYILYQNDYDKVFNELVDNLKSLKQYYNDLISIIDKKIKEPFEVLQNDKHMATDNYYTKDFNDLIKNNNLYSEKLGQEKGDAKQKIINHFIKENESDIEGIKGEINKIENNIDTIKTKIENKEKEIIKIKKSFTNTTDFAIKMTNELHSYLGRTELTIKNKDNGYQILRNNYPAKELSEGERSAIAFIYFIISLKDMETRLNNTTIVIDDPISSMDENFIYVAYQYIIDKTKDAKQRFIFSHNIGFFRLLEKGFEDSNTDNFYMMTCSVDNNNRQGIITEMNNKQKIGFSFYDSLFMKIYQEKDKTDNHENLGLANMCRQLLESFYCFKNPDKKSLENKINDCDNKTIILRYVNTQSHKNTMPFETNNNTGQIDSNIINLILGHIKQVDEIHYNGMVEKLQVKQLCNSNNTDTNKAKDTNN